MTDILPVNDFNGGMVDETDAMQPRFSKRMRNLLLDAAGKPYQRNGLKQWGIQIPTQERVNGLKIIRDPTEVTVNGSFENYSVLAYTHRKIFIQGAPTTISETAGPSIWDEITCPQSPANGNSQSVAFNVSPSTKCKLQERNQQVYLSFQNRDGYGAGNLHPRPRKVFPGASGQWWALNQGLPQSAILADVGGPGGANNYLYYTVFILTYKIGKTVYKTFGPPSAPLSVTTIHEPGIGNVHNFINFTAWPTPTTLGVNECWAYPNFTANPTSGDITLEVAVYRTRNNDTVPRFAFRQYYDGNGAAVAIADNVPDASLGAPLYTSDGSAPYDTPPPCKIHHIVGDFGYFGGFDIVGVNANNTLQGFLGAIQSAPGVFESAPGANTIASPDHLTSIENVDIYPIFFCRNSVWRVEGTIDSFGNGSPSLRPISEKIGALRQSAVLKTDTGLIFCAEDGIYFTNGFQVNKITDHLNKYYKTWWRTQDPTALDDVAMAFAPTSKRFFIGNNFVEINPSKTTPNAMSVGDLRHQTDEGGAAQTYLSGETNLTSLGYSFMPQSMDVWRDILFVGDYQGYIQQMRLEPAAAADIYPSDDRVDIAAATVGTSPVVWDYIGTVLDFGARELKKWSVRMEATFKFRYTTAQLTAQVMYANDDSFIDDTLNAMVPLKIIQDFNLPNYKKEKAYRRRFKKGGGTQGLRCQTKQIRIMKGFGNLFSSIPNGARVRAAVTVNLSTATLGSGSWPADIIGHEIRFANDAYAGGRIITVVSGATITFIGTATVLGTPVEWEIWGYPKNEAPGIETYAIAYEKYLGMQSMFNPLQTNSNP